MNFGRRAFLQFAAGVVGGTLLSPLPWKLADDSAIWSQNWSWRPSPERGHTTRKATICLFCEGGCGIQARLVEGKRAVLLEGNPAHPVNRGGICPLGAAGLQFLYAPYRVARPMKQTKSRGDLSGFRPITWGEGIEELSRKLGKLRSEGKAAALACITDARRSSMDDLWRHFFDAYGSPNLFKMPSPSDSVTLAAGIATGQEAAIGFALERASHILSFGAPLFEGWGAPGRMLATFGAWHEPSGGEPVRIVQIESQYSVTASKAEKWVAAAPGSEAALALAIAHVMIQDGSYDKGYVSESTFGFEDWTDASGKERKGFKNLVLASYSPEQVSEHSGVSAATIREIAREFASRKGAVAVWGNSQGSLPDNIYHDLAFLALNVLKGNLKPGGLVSPLPSIPLASLQAPPRVAMPPRLDLAGPKPGPLPGNGLHAFLDALAGNPTYPIEVLLVHESNPAHSLPESQVFLAALKKVGVVVSFSSYMDETAAQADFILPNHGMLERYDDVVGLPGAPFAYYAVAAPVLRPEMETRHTGEVLCELGKAVGGDVAGALAWKTYDAYLQERVKGLAASGKGAVADRADIPLGTLAAGRSPAVNYKDGADLWKKLAGGACWYDAPVDPQREPPTPSGKYELAGQILQRKGLADPDDQAYLPHFAPLPPSGKDKEYPLLLVTYPMMCLAEGYLANPPFMMKTVPDSILKGSDLLVRVHPATARELGIGEGDPAFVKTSQGEVPVRVHLFPGARPGVVYMPRGLGHKAYDAYIQDKGVNANHLIEVQIDPVTGLGTIWTTRAQMRRA